MRGFWALVVVLVFQIRIFACVVGVPVIAPIDGVLRSACATVRYVESYTFIIHDKHYVRPDVSHVSLYSEEYRLLAESYLYEDPMGTEWLSHDISRSMSMVQRQETDLPTSAHMKQFLLTDQMLFRATRDIDMEVVYFTESDETYTIQVSDTHLVAEVDGRVLLDAELAMSEATVLDVVEGSGELRYDVR